MLLFRLLGRGFVKLFRGLGYLGKFGRVYGGLFPVGLFIVSNFFLDWIRGNLIYAFSEMAKTLFSAELTINQLVHEAISNSPSYNIWSFIHILISLYILYALVRFIGKVMVGVAGSQAIVGAYVIAGVIVAIIEISAIAVIDRQFGFIPVWNGIIFLFMNIKPVINNIFISSAQVTTDVIVTNATNLLNTTNSTI